MAFDGDIKPHLGHVWCRAVKASKSDLPWGQNSCFSVNLMLPALSIWPCLALLVWWSRS